ncbi:hypothetical protein [Planctomycetes bacterium Poly30]
MHFGSALAASSTDLFVGAPFAQQAGSQTGLVFHYQLVSGDWLYSGTLRSFQPGVAGQFGTSLSLDDQRLAVSQPGLGIVEILDLSSGVPSLLDTVADPVGGSEFGRGGLELAGSTLAVKTSPFGAVVLNREPILGIWVMEASITGVQRLKAVADRVEYSWTDSLYNPLTCIYYAPNCWENSGGIRVLERQVNGSWNVTSSLYGVSSRNDVPINYSIDDWVSTPSELFVALAYSDRTVHRVGGTEFIYPASGPIQLLASTIVIGHPFNGAGGEVGVFDLDCEEVSNVGCTQTSANSTGVVGTMLAIGSSVVTRNDVTLIASDLPFFSFGFFLSSLGSQVTLNPGGSQGNLCLSGAIGRYVGAGQIMSSGADGSIELTIDLSAIPSPSGPVTALAGERRHFQLWHRDLNPGLTSNFTNSLSILFE